MPPKKRAPRAPSSRPAQPNRNVASSSSSSSSTPASSSSAPSAATLSFSSSPPLVLTEAAELLRQWDELHERSVRYVNGIRSVAGRLPPLLRSTSDDHHSASLGALELFDECCERLRAKHLRTIEAAMRALAALVPQFERIARAMDRLCQQCAAAGEQTASAPSASGLCALEWLCDAVRALSLECALRARVLAAVSYDSEAVADNDAPASAPSGDSSSDQQLCSFAHWLEQPHRSELALPVT